MPVPWEEIAISDWYRSAEVADKLKLRKAWVEQEAPQLYPQVAVSPRAKMQLLKYVSGYELPPIQENELDIITPETLNMNEIHRIESNPLFAGKDFKQQQAIKNVWYKKLSVMDPEFKSMTPEEQSSFYSKLMTRAPAFTSGATLLIGKYDTEEEITQAQRQSNTRKIVEQIGINTVSGFVQGFGSLIIAPIKLMFGEDTTFSKVIDDLQKQREWANAVGVEKGKFLAQTLPTMVGFAGGLMTGPFAGLENLLAGRVVAGGKGIARVAPGLFSKAGAAIGLKAPDLAYQVAGGAFAGMLQGLAETKVTGEDWKSAMAREATVGVAFEFVSRYLGMVWMVKKAADAAGVKVDRLFKAPLQFGAGIGIDDDLANLYKTNPGMAAMRENLKTVDPNGILYSMRDSRQGVNMFAEILGYDAPEFAGNAIRLKKGGQFIREFVSPLEDDRIARAINFFEDDDAGWDLWESTLAGKKVAEAVETIPHMEARLGVLVPEASRNHILKRLKDFKIDLGLDYYKDPKSQTEAIDRIYTILRGSRSGRKAAAALTALGVRFDLDEKAHWQSVLQLRKELNVISPETAYTVINKNNGSIIDMQDIPAVYLEHPDMKNMYVAGQIAEGNAQTVREAISSLRKNYRNQKSAITRISKTGNADLYRFKDSEIVELKVRVPLEGGLEDVQLHFSSLKSAQDFLTVGKNNGLEGAAKKFFADDDQLQKSFDDFAKSMRKYNQTEYYGSFLPYKYAAKLAKEEGYYLGVFKGKYLIQDPMADSDVAYRTFNNLRDVFGYLKNNDGRLALPDFMDTLSAKAVEVEYPRGLPDLMHDMPFEEVKRTRKFSVRDVIPRATAPPQYMFARFEKMAGLDALQERGLGPVSMYNTLRDMTRAQQSFLNRNLDQLHQALGSKKLSKKSREYMSRYIEALDDEMELASAPIKNLEYELKDDVYAEMVGAIGDGEAQRITQISNNAMRWLNDMFSLSGMDAKKYVKHYFPHMREYMKKQMSGLSSRIDPKKLTQIPEVDKKAFFELMRESDPRDYLWNRDIVEVLENYAHLMSRVVTIRPTMKEMSKVIRETTAMFAKRGAVPEDYRNYTNYVAQIFSSIEGVKGVGDEVFKYATENTLESVADFVNKKFKTNLKFKGKHDLMGTFVTMATGAHIAARPYSVGRNLTQSLLTGGSTIGLRWWMEGLNDAMRPGAIDELRRLGIVVDQTIPYGAGATITKGLINTPVFYAMKPYKWADSVNRAVVYSGMQRRIDSAYDLYRKGSINIHQFAKKSGANLFGKAEFNEAVSLLNEKLPEAGFAAFKDRLSRIAVDRTQYLYNSFDQPQMFRQGIGRMFGQYTSWPLNYWNLIKERMLSDSLTPAQKIAFYARLATVTSAIGTSMHAAGMNPQSFAPWNATTFEGGPYFQLLNDALAAANGDADAYKGVVRAVSSLVPFAYEGEGILRAVQAYQDGDPYEAFLHLASAPVRLSIYPQREIFTDTLESALMGAGVKLYQQARETDIIQSAKDTLGVNFGL